ncbi:MAG: hypothetical protein QF893_22775 [Alphaproteobacteria bacterium]|jgi:hypothetical protein|nr:hypothetical protein [Alphaproteobacteria bacterium]
MKPITIGKGERRRVLHLVFDSIPQLVRFSAEPAAGAGPVAGKVEVVGSRWLFRKPPETHELGAENVFQKGFLDSFYSVYVTPEQETRISFDSSHFRVKYLIYALGIVVILAAVSVIAMAIVRAAS